MKISFITTIFNEEKSIKKLFDSLFAQTKLPDEIIIVDGGSTDGTFKLLLDTKFPISKKNVTVLKKEGNRSFGRNTAIKKATGDIIVCSDAGNILDKDWIKNIVAPFKNKSVDVVAGYYKPITQNIFQKCLAVYTCVMPDKIDEKNFLPSSRSIAFKKTAWKKVGGYPEYLNTCEDLVFAEKMKKKNLQFVFTKEAIVFWPQKRSLVEAFMQFFNYAKGDGEALFIRPQTPLLFARYFFAVYLLFLTGLYRSVWSSVLLVLLFVGYLFWAVNKNYHYIKQKKAKLILPTLQVASDLAVLSGMTVGLTKRSLSFAYAKYIKQNALLVLIIIIYGFTLLLTIRWGIPNFNHPFPYNMDEWHQLEAVANTFRYGTPNTAGSANGTMFQFLFSGLYLIPFVVIHYINPFALHIDNYLMRERVFEVLRLQTILFGCAAIFLTYQIAKLLNISKKLSIFLFTFTPLFLSLSGYFKYDIALLFWILLSLWSIIRFAKKPTNRNYIFAAIPTGMAFAVKVSAIPLFVTFFLAYFFFAQSRAKNLRFLLLAIFVLVGCSIFFGMPDALFGKGNILFYLYENLILVPDALSGYQLGMNQIIYLITHQFPLIFGHGLYSLSIIAILYWFWIILAKSKTIWRRNRIELLLLITFTIFAVSLLKLGVLGGGNRALVLLPFLVVLSVSAIKKLLVFKKIKFLIFGIVALCLLIQTYESIAWMYIKMTPAAQENASAWLQKNVKTGTIIGIENIPIYQGIPDIIQKEFYFRQYGINQQFSFKYQLIDAKSNTLPRVIVLTSAQVNEKITPYSPQADLLRRIKREGYQETVTFYPNFTYSKILANELDAAFSYLFASPVTTTIFEK